MKTFIIYPTKGLIKAPGIAVTVKNDSHGYSNAVTEAKLRSRLSDFEAWIFM